ncbi:hypothetical protein [Corynebacterium sp. H130]|uniref:hypothetical protein n=1 Tax=Corynebacterium sp. H130 TaxID=3133444 RepID=UPI0030A46786
MSRVQTNFVVPSFSDLATSEFLPDILAALTLEELALFLEVLLAEGKGEYAVEMLQSWVKLDGDSAFTSENGRVEVIAGSGARLCLEVG